jgi:hypothetical protein
MADWCIATRMPPEVYKEMSLEELRIWMAEAKKIHGLK